MGVTVEVGHGLTSDGSFSRPADVLVARCAALDITVTSPLTPAILVESCSTAGVAAANAESRKHNANDPKCVELGWICIPLAVEAYRKWGKEAQDTFSQLASLFAAHHSAPKSKAAAVIYGRLNLTLTRSVARAILARGSKANIIRECIYNSLLRFVYIIIFIYLFLYMVKINCE